MREHIDRKKLSNPEIHESGTEIGEASTMYNPCKRPTNHRMRVSSLVS